jgi:ubiquitin-protein ligase
MQNARDIRLQSDYAHLRSLAAGSGGTLVIEETKGSPPDRYILVYKCRTIERLENGRPVYRNVNRVEIKLPAKYPAPFDAPKVRMLTPVWHPHVYKNLVVCMGDWKTSEYLDVFALRLGALLQFEKEFFDIRDPANEEAIDWARRNLLLFPTDICTFRGDPSGRDAAPAWFAPLMPLPTTPGGAHAALLEEDNSALCLDAESIHWEDLS